MPKMGKNRSPPPLSSKTSLVSVLILSQGCLPAQALERAVPWAGQARLANSGHLTSAGHAPVQLMVTVLVFSLILLLAVHLNSAFHLVGHLYVMIVWLFFVTLLPFRYNCNWESVPFVTLQVRVVLVQFQEISGCDTISEKKIKIQFILGNFLSLMDILIIERDTGLVWDQGTISKITCYFQKSFSFYLFYISHSEIYFWWSS